MRALYVNSRAELARLLPFAYAMLGEGLVILANFAMFALIKHRYGSDDLSIYMLIRRAVSMAVPLVLLGLSLSLIKHVGETQDAKLVRQYALAGAAAPLGIGVVLSVLAAWFPSQIAHLLLGSGEFAVYVAPFSLLTLSTATVVIALSFSKGLHRISLATTIQIGAFCVVPFLAYVFTGALVEFLFMTAAFWGGIGVVIWMRLMRPFRGFARVSLPRARFFTFGLKAASSEFSMMFAFWLPPVLMVASESVQISGYFSLMMTLLIVAASPLAPVGSAMMPKVARVYREGDIEGMRVAMKRLLKIGVWVSIPAWLISSHVYDLVADYLLSGAAPMGRVATQTLLTSILPLTVFYAFRNVVDVGYSPSSNLGSIIVALTVMLGCILFVTTGLGLTMRVGVVSGFTLAMWSIGAVTAFKVLRLLRSRRWVN